MSLDVYLTETIPGETTLHRGTGVFVREDGATRELTLDEARARYPGLEFEEQVYVSDEIYSANITHNLNAMAADAGIYGHLWRPDEIEIDTAEQLIAPLTEGLARLKADPDRFKELNPISGWGNYDGLVRFVENYLAACRRWPHAEVRVSR